MFALTLQEIGSNLLKFCLYHLHFLPHFYCIFKHNVAPFLNMKFSFPFLPVALISSPETAGSPGALFRTVRSAGGLQADRLDLQPAGGIGGRYSASDQRQRLHLWYTLSSQTYLSSYLSEGLTFAWEYQHDYSTIRTKKMTVNHRWGGMAKSNVFH